MSTPNIKNTSGKFDQVSDTLKKSRRPEIKKINIYGRGKVKLTGVGWGLFIFHLIGIIFLSILFFISFNKGGAEWINSIFIE